MSNLGPLEDLLRRSMDAYMRYYSAVGQLTVDYMKDVVSTWSQVRIPSPLTVSSPASSSQTSAAPSREGAAAAPPSTPQSAPRPAPQPATQSGAQAAGVMALESEAGGVALGVFLVENHLGRDVTARVSATGFTSPDGREIAPVLLFDPEVIALKPGEQVLVRVTTAVDDSLEPDVRYQGEFSVPELTGTRIPVVLRRRPDAPMRSPETRPPQGGGKKSGVSGQSRSAKSNPASSRKKAGKKKSSREEN